MKRLTVIVDDHKLFSGEVAELTWNETPDTVSVTARFAPSPSLLKTLQDLATQSAPRAPQQTPGGVQSTEPSGSVTSRPTLDVVRDKG